MIALAIQPAVLLPKLTPELQHLFACANDHRGVATCLLSDLAWVMVDASLRHDRAGDPACGPATEAHARAPASLCMRERSPRGCHLSVVRPRVGNGGRPPPSHALQACAHGRTSRR